MCKDGVHDQACYCIQPVLDRLGDLKRSQEHPYGLYPDDVYLARITPFVTHTCDMRCYMAPAAKPPAERCGCATATECKAADKKKPLVNAAGKKVPLVHYSEGTRKALDGLDLTAIKGQPAHADGAVSLPPLDPRKELTRVVMKKAMEQIVGDMAADDAATAQAQAERRKLLNDMMPDDLLLEGGAGVVPVEPEPEPEPSGAMSRQKSNSNKSKAIIEVMERPSEGEPPSGGGMGSWFTRG